MTRMIGDLVAAGHRLEHVWYGPPPERAPTIVFLHEGLGSVSAWRDFPASLAARTGLGALVYSRWGYGHSDPVTLPRPLGYMHDEARTPLPEVLDAAGIRSCVLFGHSDGGSIALLFAGSGLPQTERVRGLVLEAPHVFVEDLSLASIAAARDAYRDGDLRQRLAKHHDDVDGAFRGWNDAWLDPGFRSWNIEDVLPHIRVPALVVQGEDDPYGTLAQVDSIAAKVDERRSGAPVTKLVMPRCGHSPHRDRADDVEAAAVAFIAGLPL